MILDCNGELFFATHSIETYLGFHQVKQTFLKKRFFDGIQFRIKQGWILKIGFINSPSAFAV